MISQQRHHASIDARLLRPSGPLMSGIPGWRPTDGIPSVAIRARLCL